LTSPRGARSCPHEGHARGNRGVPNDPQRPERFRMERAALKRARSGGRAARAGAECFGTGPVAEGRNDRLMLMVNGQWANGCGRMLGAMSRQIHKR
jgi:hypothetical protein